MVEHIQRSFLIWPMIVCLTLATGCGDDDNVGGNNNNQEDAGVDAGEDATTGPSLTFQIVTFSSEDGTDIPLPGATGAFDAPGGQRTEQVADAEGWVTFTGIDWSLGSAAFTAHHEGYDIVSLVNLDETVTPEPGDGPIRVGLATMTPAPDPDMTTVTGSATGLVDAAAHDLILFPFRAAAEYGAGAGTAPYEYLVETDAPYTLVGIESVDGALPSGTGYFVDIYRAMILEHDPITAATAQEDLDLAAHEVTPLTAQGQMVLPTRADSPLRTGWPNVWVMDWESSFWHNTGWAELIDFSADGNAFDVDYIWVEPPLLEAPVTFCRVYNQGTLDMSIVLKLGYPEAGALDPPLLDVPRWVIPASPITIHPLHAAMEWELFDDDILLVTMEVYRGDQIVWRVFAEENALSLTIPLPPSSVDVDDHLGHQTLTGKILVGELDESDTYWQRLAVTGTAALDP